MDNYNYNQNDDWVSLSQPVVKTEQDTEAFENQEDNVAKYTKQKSKHPVLTFQLTVSLCILLFLFIVKFLSAPLYSAVIDWYESQLSQSVIYNGDFESSDFSALFATRDEV